MFDLSAWGALEWILMGIMASFFLAPLLVVGLMVLVLGPGILVARIGRDGGGSWGLIPGRGRTRPSSPGASPPSKGGSDLGGTGPEDGANGP